MIFSRFYYCERDFIATYFWFSFRNLVDNRLNIRFKLRDELIYYTNFNDGRERLCIFNALKREIFELTHDRQHYKEFHKTYDRIISFVYMWHLSKHLWAYINYCLKCELNQIKRYKFYDNMIFIDRLKISFHIIIMNLIMTLFMRKEGFDNLFTIIDKFLKRILLIFGRVIYNVDKWINILFVALI